MPKRKRTECKSVQPVCRSWEKFTKGRLRCPHLQYATLYSLPKRLITILRDSVEGLFSDKDVAFEMALRKFGTSVFVTRQPVFCDLLDEQYLFSESDGEEFLQFSPYQGEFDAASIADLRERFRDNQTQQFRNVLSADKGAGNFERKTRTTLENDVRLRQLGYAGWLVSHPDYRRDVLRLKDLRDEHSLPGPELFTSECDKSSRSARYVFESRAFLIKWALSRVITWDLPVPLCPGLFPGDAVPPNDIAPTGVSMFLPWPFLVDQKFQIRRLANFYRTRIDLSHLSGWLSKKDKWGALRYSRLMEMYIYFELALKQRYSERIQQRLAKLDLAFAQYWRLNERANSTIDNQQDSVEDVRRKLAKRLEDCDSVATETFGQNSADQKMISARAFFESGVELEGDE